MDAQAGDALIKLAAYLAPHLPSAEAASRHLQKAESNRHLGQLFFQWREEGDAEVLLWGPELSRHRRATVVEALLWRRFGRSLLDGTSPHLLQLLELLSAPPSA